MPAGISSEEYLNVFDRVVKKLEDFKPEFILISAGFDAHEDDPLAQFNLKTEDYFTITKSCLLYTSPSPRDLSTSRMPSSA